MSAELIQARRDAIDRGDKNLGREIYHQLIGMGYQPADLDGDGPVREPLPPTPEEITVPDEAAVPEEPETTEAPAAPEAAVKPGPKSRAAKKS